MFEIFERIRKVLFSWSFLERWSTRAFRELQNPRRSGWSSLVQKWQMPFEDWIRSKWYRNLSKFTQMSLNSISKSIFSQRKIWKINFSQSLCDSTNLINDQEDKGSRGCRFLCYATNKWTKLRENFDFDHCTNPLLFVSSYK